MSIGSYSENPKTIRKSNIEFHVIVFLRNDIYHHLIIDPADRGKETAVLLDWNDPEVFKEIIERRIARSVGTDQPFDVLWQHFFDTHVYGEDSFSYILDRTFMRPRDALRFTRECINTAINRGHDKVLQEDILEAEKDYSSELLADICFDLRDVNPDFTDIPYAFIDCKKKLSKKDIIENFKAANISNDKLERALELLLWFGFIGIFVNEDDERYMYQYQHDIKRFDSGLGNYAYCIHPGFRKTLGCT